MNAQTLLAAVVVSLIARIAFAQMPGYGGGMTQSNQPAQGSKTEPGQTQTTTTTKTVYPQGVKGYLDSQMASSRDKKFHVSLNGKDVPLSPVKIHEEKKLGGGKSTAAAEMKGPDGKIYEINFALSGGIVSGASIGKVNGQRP